MDVNRVKSFFIKEYGVTPTELDKGEHIPSCLYMHKSYFRFKGEYLPQDFCKGGKANSIYNRMRGQSQSGADVRLLWTIETSSLAHADYLESIFQNFAFKHRVNKDQAFGTELYLLSDIESIGVLKEFVKEYDLENDSRIVRISVYNDTTRAVLFEKIENIHNTSGFYSRSTPKNNFEGLFECD